MVFEIATILRLRESPAKFLSSQLLLNDETMALCEESARYLLRHLLSEHQNTELLVVSACWLEQNSVPLHRPFPHGRRAHTGLVSVWALPADTRDIAPGYETRELAPRMSPGQSLAL